MLSTIINIRSVEIQLNLALDLSSVIQEIEIKAAPTMNLPEHPGAVAYSILLRLVEECIEEIDIREYGYSRYRT